MIGLSIEPAELRRLDDPAEVIVLQTLRAIEHFASRIELAYLRRRPQWRQLAPDARLWPAAVAVLVEANRLDPRAPLDPELFVACVTTGPDADPWVELTRPAARTRYLSRVRAMIRTLRGELTREIRKATKLIAQGRTADELLRSESRSLTPLARYFVAVRLDRLDLVSELRDEARTQHEACPLYREASVGLIPPQAYPASDFLLPGIPASPRAHFSLN